MPRLPDIDDLGARPVPQSRRGVVSVRNAGAVGEGLSQVGRTVQGIGEQQLEREDKLSYASAKMVLLKADIAARQELEADPDFGTAEQRYVERMAKARASASSLIRGRFDRRLFEVDAQSDVDRGLGVIRGMVRKRQFSADRSALNTDLSNLQASARDAADDATRVEFVRTAHVMIDGAIAKGLDPVEAAKLKDEWGSGYAAGQVSAAIDKGNIVEASATFERLKGFLSDDAFISLNRQLDNLKDENVVLGAADAALSTGDDTGPPKNIPALVTSLFPGAVITSGKRDPNSALGRANPRSHHNVGNAVDVRPIPGVTFEEFVARMKESGVNVVEAIDEVKNPSKHATGPHWHIAWKPPARRKAPETLEDAVNRAYSHLGANATPDQRRKAAQEVTARWNLGKAAEKERDDAAVESVQQMLVDNGGNWYGLPSSVRARVPAKYHTTMIGFGNGLRSGTSPSTDPEEYVRLSTMAESDPAAFAAINPIEYHGKLDTSDWERFVNMRSQILGKGGDESSLPSITEVRSVTNPILEAAGLSDVGLTQKTDKKGEKRQEVARRVYNFEKALLGDIAIWQRNNPGKKPDALDIQKMADRRLVSTIPAGSSDVVPQFEARGGGVVKIPEADLKRIIAVMTPILGRMPTNDEVVQAYLREGRGS